MKLITVILLVFFSTLAIAEGPRYKPSSRAAEPIDVSTNAYGASALAPDALSIGDPAPDFDLPVSGGGRFQLGANGPFTAMIFYRGHW